MTSEVTAQNRLTLKPEVFDAGVANWLRTLEPIPPWWESFREALYQEMGNPGTDHDNCRRGTGPLYT